MWNSGASAKIGEPAGLLSYRRRIELLTVRFRWVLVAPFGDSTRSGRVGHERDVVRDQTGIRHAGPRARPGHLEQVRHALGAHPGHAPEHPWVAGRLDVEFARGQRDPHTRGGCPLRHPIGPRVLAAHDRGDSGVGEDVGELVPVHRVQRDDDTARLPRAEQRQHELRDVLQVDREPVALPRIRSR